MKYCNQCGAAVALKVPEGDNRPRYICADCGTTHYENPKIVAGCVAEWDGAILLCRRAIEPRLGFWTAPAGFMELDESVPEAAARETWEEAEARVNIGAMIACVDVIQAHQVHIFFAGTMSEPIFGAGTESLETALFQPEDIPWDKLAFPSVRIALEQFLRNRDSERDELQICTAPRRRIV